MLERSSQTSAYLPALLNSQNTRKIGKKYQIFENCSKIQQTFLKFAKFSSQFIHTNTEKLKVLQKQCFIISVFLIGWPYKTNNLLCTRNQIQRKTSQNEQWKNNRNGQIQLVIDISQVGNRTITIKILVQGTIVSAISVYDPQCAKGNSQKDKF